jgi:hypothetical protein
LARSLEGRPPLWSRERGRSEASRRSGAIGPAHDVEPTRERDPVGLGRGRLDPRTRATSRPGADGLCDQATIDPGDSAGAARRQTPDNLRASARVAIFFCSDRSARAEHLAIRSDLRQRSS